MEDQTRRSVLAGSAAGLGLSALEASQAAAQQRAGKDAPIPAKDNLKITKLETILVKPRWVFLKIYTDAGIVGVGEPIVEGRPKTTAMAVQEAAAYLIGKDPRRVAHHWQAIYRQAFYRGGPVLTSALSGIDEALWDIKGKALGVPVYELLGGPTRDRVKAYAKPSTPEQVLAAKKRGFTAFKVGTPEMIPRNARLVETPGFVKIMADKFAALREAAGPDSDFAIDFHGAMSPQTAMLLIKALEPYQPMFIEEPVQCQNVQVMADIARKTHIPIATGERIFTKWGFREILEKGAASVLQPDCCHAGGITEVRLIAGMAEAYYAAIAPHNPLGPISLASCVQVAASIPNFLIQEQSWPGDPGEGYLKVPMKIENSYIQLPTAPGLGVELDDNKLADKIVTDFPSSSRDGSYLEDGSVVDR